MKLSERILLCLLPVALCACSRQDGLTSGESVRVVVGIPDGSTRTVMGEMEGLKVPVYWTEGDCVTVNGVRSYPLESASGQISQAEFKVNNVEPPYEVVYPASAYAGTSSGGNLLIDIPSSQIYRPESFGDGADILFGSSDGGTVLLDHLCGILRLNFTNEDNVTVSKLSLTSLGAEPVCGIFSLDRTSLALTAVQQTGKTLTLDIPDGGVTVGPGPVSFHFALPAGEYPDGFELKFEDGERRILRRYWLRSAADAPQGVSVKAGKIVNFPLEEYVPGVREICSAEDWEMFAAACNSAAGDWEKDWVASDGTVRIGSDFTADRLTTLTAFSGILDGCGYTITLKNGNSPLVKTHKGVIRNLTVAGRMEPSDPNTLGGTVFTSVLSGGTISDCCNKAEIVISSSDTPDAVCGAFARTINGGTIERCSNEGNITIISSLTKEHKLLAGGIAAIASGLTSEALIKDCTNSGNISVTCAKQAASTSMRPINASYAGIIANVVSGTQARYLTISGCTNGGNISVCYSPDPTGAQALVSGAGGILGMSVKLSATGAGYSSASADSYYLVIENCTNHGAISNGLVSSDSSTSLNKAYSGGIAGVVHGLSSAHAIVSGCLTDGTVTCYEGSTYSRAALCTVSGGLLGCGAYIDISDCTVSSTRVGTLKKQSFAVSGGVGLLHQAFTMSGCKFFADLYAIRSKTFSEKNYSLGFTLPQKSSDGNITGANLTGSSVTGCSFGGSFTTNETLVDYNASSVAGTTLKNVFTASDFASFIASPSCAPDVVTMSGNSWWDGN